MKITESRLRSIIRDVIAEEHEHGHSEEESASSMGFLKGLMDKIRRGVMPTAEELEAAAAERRRQDRKERGLASEEEALAAQRRLAQDSEERRAREDEAREQRTFRRVAGLSDDDTFELPQ